ncbi:hypothetical protein WAI453_010436 [Rhynchosporium graminicola]
MGFENVCEANGHGLENVMRRRVDVSEDLLRKPLPNNYSSKLPRYFHRAPVRGGSGIRLRGIKIGPKRTKLPDH